MHDRYFVIAEPPLSPPGISAELLGNLAAALNALGTPAADALDDLTVDMVELAFNSIPPKERQRLLNRIGIRMAAPRRAGKALCRDVLARMRRDTRQNSCTCSAKTLTQQVFSEVTAAAITAGAAMAHNPSTRWSETLVRLTVFSWIHASAADARIVVWASDQNWLGARTDLRQQLDAVRDAARLVVDATPGFSPNAVGPTGPKSGMAKAAGASTLQAPPTSQMSSTASDPGQAVVGEPDEMCDVLAAAVEAAKEPALRICAAVEDGRPPAEQDLRRLAGLGADFDNARSALSAAGIEDVPLRLDDMMRAARSHRADRDRDRAGRRTLHALLLVECREDSPVTTAAEAVRVCARSLLDTPVWGEEEREQSAALSALAEIVRLRRQSDTTAEILTLQEQVVRVLPACAMAAVMAQELTLPGSGDVPSGPDTAVEDEAMSASNGTAWQLEGGPPDGTGAEAAPEAAGSPITPSGEDGHAPAKSGGQLAPIAGEPARVEESGRQYGTEPEPERRPSGSYDPSVPAVTRPESISEEKESLRPEMQQADLVTPTSPALVDATYQAEEDDGAHIDTALVRLVAERRFGLAFHLARAAGRPESQVTSLQFAAAAALPNSGNSRSARVVRDLLQQPGAFTGRETEGNELVLLPALLRAALITGEHVTGAQLKALVPRLPAALAGIATTVADRALSGALVIASPLAVIADVSETEIQLRELREQGRALTAPPRFRFARATDIAKRWLALDGMLGAMLNVVVEDDRQAAPAVREEADRLSKPSEINGEIDRMDRMDRRDRATTGKPLQGSGRRDLVHLVERIVALVKDWCLATEEFRRTAQTDGGRTVQKISAMRQSVLSQREAALSELEQLTRRPGTFAAAAAWAAHDSLSELFTVLAGNHGAIRRGDEVDAEIAIDAELLKIPSTPDTPPELDRLLTAVDRTWEQALRTRTAEDAFGAAYTILDLADRDVLPASEGLCVEPEVRSTIERQESERRTALRTAHDELVAELHRSQAEGAVTDDQDLRLQELLADAHKRLEDAAEHDLSTVRRSLDEVRAKLPEHRQEAADRIRARLEALPDVGGDQRAQVLRHLNTGGLATAADLVYFLEIGEPVPEIEAGEPHLTDFFPVVPDGLPKGLTPDLVELVRSGGKHSTVPVLEYGNLSGDEAALAAAALADWRELGAVDARERPNINARLKLLPALKLIGYDAKTARPLDDLSHTRREYRFFEITGVEVNGRARVPAFGSQIKEQGGTLRVLMLWGRPPAKLLMSLAAKDPSGASLLVAYFGTLGREARTELALESDRLQPLLVVDDTALAYLAARGNRQISTATEILLPFSGVNPYIREKRGRIGGEMFYGRDAERKSILDPRGTQVIFGGRGLGKSALLSDAGDRFREQRPGFHHAVYLNLDQDNIGKGSSLGAEAIWSVLNRELTDAQLLDRPQGRKVQKTDPYDRVRAGIRSWLDGDSRRRLLVLMDECDLFFEADAPHFTQTKRLKGLGADTQDRAKVVFAGLHSVQRFSKLARNGPFGHLAQTPKVIGPLAPQFAADLLVDPMRALGFEFSDVDLVNRVLGYCSYQPFLLQMFGHRLVEVMHRKRARRGFEGPPYTVTVDDVESVESDATLRAGITAAFKDTLSLDDRYDVIANVLAQHARNHGLETRLSDAELREECETWWRAGFEQLDTEGFRAYLSEMVGLGVLAPNHDGRGWHLRGPNALRMIGTSQEVEARLLGAERECKLEESIMLQGRPELSDRRSAPLTITQLDDLLGDRSNQTRVVLGTAATGIGDVAGTLRTVAGRIADWTLPPIGKPSVYKQELTGGRPRERRVVISDFANYPVSPETCRDAVDLAETLLPGTPGVTRAVVLVTDTGYLDLWRALLTGEEGTSAVPVILRRHDLRSLRGWAQRIELFDTDERLERLYRLTSGWPLLVDRALRLHVELGDQDESLLRLADGLTTRAAAREFLAATGVYANPALASGYRAVSDELGGELTDAEEIVTAIGYADGDEDEARWIFACLEALQVFDKEGTRLRLEPLFRRCWSLAGD
ncbi:hypothetical protein ACFV1F_31060 [Streptomyces sp. NPDC059590]|uniref:hypothetical protein n=1 Tax=Streptomyces sp. NPDC059590 TaxID=3346877 RepID=UPI0036C6DF13